MKRKSLRLGKGFRVAFGTAAGRAPRCRFHWATPRAAPDNRHRGADQWLFVVSGTGTAIGGGKRRFSCGHRGGLAGSRCNPYRVHGRRAPRRAPGWQPGTAPAGTSPMKTTRHVRVRREEHWPPPRLRGVRVLIVEDDAEEREFLVALLDAAGADVRSASSASEALATLVWWRPGVLVSDIGLQGASGYDLMEAVRALPEAAREPPAAVTGQAAPEDRRRAMRAGFQAHLAKPVDPDRLVQVLAGLAGTAAPAAAEPSR